MPRIMLDGQEYVVAPSPATWADLLGAIERDVDTRGLLVVAVRMDGVDLPAFRDAEALARPLAPGAIVEVETSTPDALLNDGLREASRSVAALADAAVSLADGYRRVDVSEADAQLATFADTLGNLMALVATAAQIRRVDLTTLEIGGQRASETVTQLNRAVETLLDAHGHRDWVTLADVLEHDLAPLMSRVSLVIGALGPVTE